MRRTEQWLTPLQFARAIHVSRSTVYRRIEEGDIDTRLIEFAGPRKILLHTRAVRYFRAFWRRRRAGGVVPAPNRINGYARFRR